jgi:hypothetical protein
LQDVEWLRSITGLPILLKGIVTGEDGNEFYCNFSVVVIWYGHCELSADSAAAFGQPGRPWRQGPPA